MSPKLAHMLSTSVLQPARVGQRRAPSELIRKGVPDDTEPDDRGLDGLATYALRRTRIWQFDSNLHCSIIGTCLTTAELRHILEELRLGGASAVSDHELHGLGVTLAGRQRDGAKVLQKALDRRHRAAINRYSKAKDIASLLALWEASLKQGDIPGAYWAVLTHPTTTKAIVQRVFGDVHMLSHLVGAANHADIRRLRQLEQENAALAAKVARQQSQLHAGFAERDQAIRRLNEMLIRHAGDQAAQSCSSANQEEEHAVDAVICDLNKRFAHETARRERSEQRVIELSARLREAERVLQANRKKCELTYQELELVEHHLAVLAQPETHGPSQALDLSGITLLYVGGRAHQIAQLKGLSERASARFLYHDGGIEHSSGLLPGLISRADHILFPIDCISHEAAATIKRLCRQTSKNYEPLRTASLTCFLSALLRMHACSERVAVE